MSTGEMLLWKYAPGIAKMMRDEEGDQILTYVGILVLIGGVILVLRSVFSQAGGAAEGTGSWFGG